MKLLIISHTPHCLKDGKPAGWTATVREINHLAELFKEVVHIAPLYKEDLAESVSFYKAPNVVFRSVKPAGGKTLADKLRILLQIPEYISAICEELEKCDAVHVRCPSNISLIALFILVFKKSPKKRWLKYAGNWMPDGRESWSYTLQRWILKKGFSRGEVTVNGEWPGQPKHIHAFLNPCISQRELQHAGVCADLKQVSQPVRLLFVGRVEKEKGPGFLLQVLSKLSDNKIEAFADIVGDGPERVVFERQAAVMKLKNVRFHGWLSRENLNELYKQAHFLVLPSIASEGWPKVLSEAMAFGALPVTANTGSIPHYLEKFETGKTLPAKDPELWALEIMKYIENPETFSLESMKAAKAAVHFSYSVYSEKVKTLMDI